MSTPKKRSRSITRGRSEAVERRGELEVRLLDAVTLLLGEHAYTELSIQQIADAAGIGRSTFYWHFPDKTELLLRLAERATHELFTIGADWGAHADEAGIEGLTATLGEMIGLYRRHAPILRAVSELAAYEPTVADYWRRLLSGGASTACQELVKLQATGLISPDVDLEATTHVLALMVERAIAEHVAFRGVDADPHLAAVLGRMVWLCSFGDTSPDKPDTPEAPRRASRAGARSAPAPTR